jgi:ATP-dependent protease ClpP protease subunit
VGSWNDVNALTTKVGSAHDVVRRQALADLHKATGRNTIAYYSAWLQKDILRDRVGDHFSLNDSDKSGFMAVIHKMDRSKGLDLLLHTPGGDAAATESLVDYLRSMFANIRVIVPQLALSAGTMIACAAHEIMMGKHSSLGPVDPQIGGLPAHGIIEEFNRARQEIMQTPATIPLWQAVVAKYPPSIIGECQKAIEWSSAMVIEWLKTGMFKDDPEKDTKAAAVLAELGDHAITKSHARHISFKRACEIGLNVKALEADQALQDAVLTVHHASIQTMQETPVVKLIENHEGITFALQFAPQR